MLFSSFQQTWHIAYCIEPLKTIQKYDVYLQVAIMLIKERKRLFEKLVEAQRERSKAEVLLASAANKNSAGDGASKKRTYLIT